MEYVLNVFLPKLSARIFSEPLVWFGRHIKDHFVPHERNNYHPHILGHRALGLFSALLVTVKVATIIVVAVGPVIPAYSSAITTENIISLTNASRKDFSLNALSENPILDKAAQAKADDMLAKGYFAHNTPDGKTPWDFITGAGYSYLSAGENLAVNFTEAESVQTAWMNSPGHKANILNKIFEDIGIGISQGQYQGHTAIFVVQEFGTPAEQKVTLTEKPTPVQTQAVPPPPATSAVAAKKIFTPKPSQPAPAKSSVLPQAVSGQQEPLPALAIVSSGVSLSNGLAEISVKTSEVAVKVLAQFGQQAIMLEPKSATSWQGNIPMDQLAGTSAKVSLKAFDMSGSSLAAQLADFGPTAVENFNVVGDVAGAHISALGKVFDPKVYESRFYLFFIAGLLSSLIFAIGIRRHIQHLSLIANSSFVVIFACLLWMAG